MSEHKSQSKSKPAKKGTRISSADTLVKDAGIELNERDLNRVSGGSGHVDAAHSRDYKGRIKWK